MTTGKICKGNGITTWGGYDYVPYTKDMAHKAAVEIGRILHTKGVKAGQRAYADAQRGLSRYEHGLLDAELSNMD